MGLPPMALAGLGTPVAQHYGRAGDQGVIRYWAANQDAINPYTAHFLGFTLVTGADTRFQTTAEFTAMEVMIGGGHDIIIKIGQGQVWSVRRNWIGATHMPEDAGTPASTVSTAKVAIPTGQQSVDIWVQWDNSSQTGTRAQVSAGSVTTGFVSLGAPMQVGSNNGADQIKGRVTIGQALSMRDVFYSVRNVYGGGQSATGDAWRPRTYAADLDRGLNRFSHLPPPKAMDAWDVIREVAAAEMGAVFWDEEGVFRFWNFDTIAEKQLVPVRTLSLDHVGNLRMVESSDSVRNAYSVQTTSKRSVYGGEALYDSSDPNEFYVPARTVREFTLWRDDIQSPLTFYMQKYTTLEGTGFPTWSDSVIHGYCIQYLIGGVWQERADRVEQPTFIRVYFTAEGFLKVKIDNWWTEPVRLASGATSTFIEGAQGAFRFSGTRVTNDATLSKIVKDRTSIARYGTRNLELSGTWWQFGFSRTMLVPKMLVRTGRPIPATDGIQIAGDPRLQLGDTLRVVDPDGLGAQVDVQILGIRRTLDGGGLADDLTVELVSRAAKPDPVSIWEYWDSTSQGGSTPEPPPSGGGGGEEGTAAAAFGWGTPHSISDEFDYSGPPNSAKWTNAPSGGMAGHNGNGTRIAYCATVSGGKLILKGMPNGDSAWIMQNLDVQYGRWEMRAKSYNIGGSGNVYHCLALIWPTSEAWPNDGEYDWFEIEDPDDGDYQGYLHYPHPNMPVQQEFVSVAGALEDGNFHNIGFEWTSSGLKGFIDGAQVWSLSGGANGSRSNIQAMPMGHLNLQIDNFDGSGMRECAMEVEWVRFYPV